MEIKKTINQLKRLVNMKCRYSIVFTSKYIKNEWRFAMNFDKIIPYVNLKPLGGTYVKREQEDIDYR